MATTQFPVVWNDPADAQLFWRRDTVHEPRPSLPFRRSFGETVIGPAVERAAEVLSLPGRSRSMQVNGYSFSTRVPDPPEVAAQKLKVLAECMPQHIADLPRRWREEFEPELQRDLAIWRAFDLRGAAFDSLAQHFEDAMPRAVRHWEIHFLTVQPVLASTAPLAKLVEQLAGDLDEQAPYRLVAGFASRTTERDHALWHVSELARRAPAVREAFSTVNPHELMPVLRGLGDLASAAFLNALEDYLAHYGDRGEGFFSDPTWREDPSFLLVVLKSYLAGARRYPDKELAGVADDREQFIQETLAKIPGERRAEFTQVLKAAQAVYPLRETHAFFIDQASVSQLRYIVVELARRLSAMRVLEQPDDVFYLHYDELREALHNPGLVNHKALIVGRRADHARWSQLAAPSWIGTQPPELAQGKSEPDKFHRFVETDLPPGRITQLKGAAASRGVGRGVVRVVLRPDEFARVQPGDVLVCPTTFPPWTALFRIIAGLVTDSGGVLSHGAIVAREYNLPAVVGTGFGTRALVDGQRVEVDGNTGVVTILD